jgi:hypothetical protein
MLRKMIFLSILVGFMASTVLAKGKAKDLCNRPVFLTGLEDVQARSCADNSKILPSHLDDYTPGSVIDTVGTTWYDNQHNGTFGKMTAVDSGNYVHFVWTNGLNSGITLRHVYYNLWDPSTHQFMIPGGGQVDASSRAGFATVAVNREGFAFPAFHQISGPNPLAAVAIDFLPRTGAFTAFPIPGIGDAQIIWPKVAADFQGNLHLGMTENGGNELDYYIKGFPHIVDGMGESITYDLGLVEWETSTFVTMDVAASWHIPRVAVAWIDDPDGNENPPNVMVRISEDAGLNWGTPINVTNIPPIDPECCHNGGTPEVCNGDTLHPWIDLSVIFDNQDQVHVAYTTHGWYYFDENCDTVMQGYVFSRIQHWDGTDEQHDFVHEAWYAHSSVALGTNNLMCHRPNLAIDTTTGDLFCSFQQFDSVQTSSAGYPQGDAWIASSTDGGMTWYSTNVTATDGGVNTPAGQCRSERDICLATFVSSDTLHLYYMLDRDAGSAPFNEGVYTLNPMIYQRIPVSDVMAPVTELRAFVLTDLALYQNFPNPFNPATKIQFDLRVEGRITLKVFDVLGREVAAPLNSTFVSAGTHVVEFDGSRLSSGIYFYRLEQGGHLATRKMILMK